MNSKTARTGRKPAPQKTKAWMRVTVVAIPVLLVLALISAIAIPQLHTKGATADSTASNLRRQGSDSHEPGKAKGQDGMEHIHSSDGSTTSQGQDHVQRVVIVGGGLAGCMAALQAHSHAASLSQRVEIVLIDKESKLGGNSAKASSGINALNPPAGDSEQLFQLDTIKSGGGLSRPDLVEVLVVGCMHALHACLHGPCSWWPAWRCPHGATCIGLVVCMHGCMMYRNTRVAGMTCRSVHLPCKHQPWGCLTMFGHD